jgi:hypothetical protein
MVGAIFKLVFCYTKAHVWKMQLSYIQLSLLDILLWYKISCMTSHSCLLQLCKETIPQKKWRIPLPKMCWKTPTTWSFMITCYKYSLRPNLLVASRWKEIEMYEEVKWQVFWDDGVGLKFAMLKLSTFGHPVLQFIQFTIWFDQLDLFQFPVLRMLLWIFSSLKHPSPFCVASVLISRSTCSGVTEYYGVGMVLCSYPTTVGNPDFLIIVLSVGPSLLRLRY